MIALGIRNGRSSRLSLSDRPLEKASRDLSTNGSSLMSNGQRGAGYATTTEPKVSEATTPPPDTSAQKAGLTVLTRALVLCQERKRQTTLLTLNMPSWWCMHTGQCGKKEDYQPQITKTLNMPQRSWHFSGLL